jgi:hypothetical protein
MMTGMDAPFENQQEFDEAELRAAVGSLNHFSQKTSCRSGSHRVAQPMRFSRRARLYV